MEQKRFYVDTCIWLNLFKKEGDETKGVPYWEIAEDFICKIISSEDCEILYSDIIIREIKFKTDDDSFSKITTILMKEPKFRIVQTTEEDYSLARKLESESFFEISFYDCINLAICKRLGSILVTRDAALIRFARRYITAERPENLLT